jgi:hypothetical protein
MTLHAIVEALGGDLYQGGWRANVPAPGHSAKDRSVSLLLTQGRVIIHGFGGTDWRAMRDVLQRGGFIHADGRLPGAGSSEGAPARPDRRLRLETALRLWTGAGPLQRGDPASRHLVWRGVRPGGTGLGLRLHRTAPSLFIAKAGEPGRPSWPGSAISTTS